MLVGGLGCVIVGDLWLGFKLAAGFFETFLRFCQQDCFLLDFQFPQFGI